ncbi:aminoacyl-tRNA hydrolase [Spiroplasma sp. AdecLV25b]|uniref:aminoacyl-tRNA hydrolase n=1 Tax=Spiroplasma sp. AdecLV25b TaxID=3027162 RepID=UPI0027E1D212|nr:aminoacyl-tRNA hydrolase [Spiroplasma sp. AdecLV25b]
MKLVVGLGNPGRQYELTRHNIGFMIVDMVCKNLKLNISQNKFDGEYVKIVVNNQDVIFLKPLTFMNLSGRCVSKFMNYFKIQPQDVLIIHDEVDLNFGQFQYKQNFSAAGHNGIKSIFHETNIKTYQRLRIGVGKNPYFNTADWVLSNFSKVELTTIKNDEDFLIESVISWITNDKFEDIMNKYNKKSA